MDEKAREFAHNAAAQAAIEATRDIAVVGIRLETYNQVYKGVFKTVRETFAELVSGK